MKKIKIGDLQQLMPHTHVVKLSYDAVYFRGVVPDPFTGTTEPFFIGREISRMPADERAILFDLILPNGEKFSDVLQKIRNYYGRADAYYEMPPEARERHLACHETHVKCKHYGGFCNYCFKLQRIIKNPVPCPYFEETLEKTRRDKNAQFIAFTKNPRLLSD